MADRWFAKKKRLAVCVFSLAALSTTAGSLEPQSSGASAPLSTRLRSDVSALVGDAECDDQSQCHVTGVGTKPCGGPDGYLAWSDKRTDPNALRMALVAHARAEADESKANGLASDCRVSPMPAAVCRPRAPDGKKVCQLGQGGADSAI